MQAPRTGASATAPSAPGAVARTAVSAWWVGALFACAAAVRVGGVLWAHSAPDTAARVVTPDSERVYLAVASNVAAGLGFVSGHDVTAPLTIAPVYPLWLAALQEGAGPPAPAFVGLLHALLRSLAVLAVLGIGRRLLPVGAAFCAAALYACDPWEAYWTPFVLKESVAVPLMLVAVAAVLEAGERRTARAAALAGATGAAAALAWFGALVLGPWLAWTLGRRAGAQRLLAAAAAGAVPVLGSWLALVVAPLPAFAWQDAPHRALYRFAVRPLAPQAPTVGHPPAKANTAVADLRAAAQRGRGEVLQLALERIPANLARSAVNLLRPVEAASAPVVTLVFGTCYAATAGLAVVGLWLARRGRNPLGPLPALIGTLVLLLLLVGGGVRQRQYLMPLLVLPAGLALARGASALAGRWGRSRSNQIP